MREADRKDDIGEEGAPKPSVGEVDSVFDNFLPYIFYRISNRFNLDLLEDLRPLKINVARWRVLAILAEKGGCNIGELSIYTMMEQSAVSRVVDSMEKEGLARRQPDKEDNRIVQVFLTPAGREAYLRIFPKAVSRQTKMLRGISDRERAALIRLMKKIWSNIGHHPWD